MSHYASETFLHQLLGKALAAGASDVHLKIGKPPGARVGAELVFFRVDEIRPEDTEAALTVFLGPQTQPRRSGDLTFAYEAEAVGRFRVSAFRQRTGISLVMRPIPKEPPTLASLSLSADLASLVSVPRGLVVVAGPPGSGRSSTAAALVRHVNERRLWHVVTFEDPVEHLHADRAASVAQRRVGVDVPSLEAGLRGVARLDVDCVLAADLRAPAELDAALDVASHALVLAVIDASSAAAAMGRLLHLADGVPFGVERLADTLSAVVVQTSASAPASAAAPRATARRIDGAARELLRRGEAPAFAEKPAPIEAS